MIDIERELAIKTEPAGLWTSLSRPSSLKLMFLMIGWSAFISILVTFILAGGIQDPNQFFNELFMFWQAYLWVVPTVGAVWGLFLSLGGIIFRSYLLPRMSRWQSAPIRILAIGASAYAMGFLLMMAIYKTCQRLVGLEMWDPDWLIAVAIISGLVGVVFGYVFMAGYANQMQLWRAELREKAHAQHQAMGALMNLNLRIRPHFFFNALNTLSNYIDTDPDKAQLYLSDMAQLFRISFSHGQDGPTCSWHEERQLIMTYLALEAKRFDDKLNVSIDINARDDDPFPAFLLQPLIENAVHHGIAPCNEEGSIKLTGSCTAGSWNLALSNTAPEDARVSIRQGHALWTIRERLHLLGGDLDVQTEQGQVMMRMRWHHDE